MNWNGLTSNILEFGLDRSSLRQDNGDLYGSSWWLEIFGEVKSLFSSDVRSPL